MNNPLWSPSDQQIDSAQVTQFKHQVNNHYGLNLSSYEDLHQWSIANPAEFWSLVWNFCGVVGDNAGEHTLLNADQFPGARWFPDATLNFAENLLRFRDDRPALVSLLEKGERQELSYAQLYKEVASLAAALRAEGVTPGDRVAAILPNIAETIVAMLAATSIGAVWSSCSPDFGLSGLLDRIGQVEPKVLFCCDGYYYNHKAHESLTRAHEVASQISSIQRLVVVPVVNKGASADLPANSIQLADFAHDESSELSFEQLPFDHPLCIMFSSGTTGKPKCIVHGAGGTLLQHLKEHRLAVDLRRNDVFFFYSTCGWMMWNWLVSGLASGATLILFDGSPFADDGNALLDAVDSECITVFGVSAKYLSALEKSGKTPTETHNLKSLRVVLSTGSPLSPGSFDYVYQSINDSVCLSSISGGTDIISCFVLGSPILPVYRGEIQSRGLGLAVEIWDNDANSIIEEKGDLVCVKPFPCAPIGFWNDADGSKYRQAYFSRWPNIWAHGDYGEITANNGIVIHGRSDALLNPGGVRIGTAEIYRQVEKIDAVQESIVVGQDWGDDVRVVLFVVLKNDLQLNDELKEHIKATIRSNTTARHVPAKIIQVQDIPRTISGKIVEMAVREVIHNREVKNVDALANPQALEYFRNLTELET